MPTELYVYDARLLRVVDGDTVDVEIDKGDNYRVTQRLRFLGLNSPEPKGKTKVAGDAATEWVKAWFAGCDNTLKWPIRVQTKKRDNLCRQLSDVWDLKTGEHLNKAILNAMHAITDIRR